MRVSLLLLTACAGPLVSDVPVERVVAEPAEAAPPGSLGLTARGVVPGGLATLTVDGATPGELVYFAGNVAGFGAGPCPGVLGGLCMDLAPPVKLLGSATASPDGVATLYWRVPPSLPGPRLFMQAGSSSPPSTSVGIVVEPGVDDCDYIGGWPCHPDADALPDPGFGGAYGVGEMMPRAVFADQYGDEVDLYDLLGEDRMVLVQVSAAWSPPDQAFFGELTGGAPFSLDPGSPLLDAIATGEVGYVVILEDNVAGGPPTADDCRDFALFGGGVDVPVLADPDRAFAAWMALWAYPSGFVVNPDGTLAHGGELVYDAAGWLEGEL